MAPIKPGIGARVWFEPAATCCGGRRVGLAKFSTPHGEGPCVSMIHSQANGAEARARRVLPAVRLPGRNVGRHRGHAAADARARAVGHRCVGVVSAARHAVLRSRAGTAWREAELGGLERPVDDVQGDLCAGCVPQRARPGASRIRARKAARAGALLKAPGPARRGIDARCPDLQPRPSHKAAASLNLR